MARSRWPTTAAACRWISTLNRVCPGSRSSSARLHAGGKFSNKNYQFSGGLHGVGVSVVNALSSALEVVIRRDGQEYRMTFADGDKQTDLEIIDTCGKRNTGTSGALSARPAIFRFVDVLRFRACAMCCGPRRCSVPA